MTPIMADDTAQFLLRPSRKLIKYLDSLARQFGRKSGNQVAVEIIEQYAPFYEQAEQAKQDVLKRQKELLGQTFSATVLGEPPYEADEIEDKLDGEMAKVRGKNTTKTPQSQRETKRGKK